MFVIRATQRLLKRGAAVATQEPPATRTVLGDWYANVLVVRPEHLVLAVSERTMLPVVVPAKDVKRLPARIAAAARQILLAIEVAPELVEREVAEMQAATFAKTNNRRVLGGLNDFMFQLEYACHAHPELSLLEQALRLAKTPSGVIERVFPDQAARSLFEAAAVLQRLKGAV